MKVATVTICHSLLSSGLAEALAYSEVNRLRLVQLLKAECRAGNIDVTVENMGQLVTPDKAQRAVPATQKRSPAVITR